MSVRVHPAASADDILDAGAGGLAYFDSFAPRYARLTGTVDQTDRIRARYDDQRGLDLAAIGAAAGAVGRAAEAAQEQVGAHAEQTAALAQAWRDDSGADAAHAALAEHVQRAGRDAAAVGDAAAGLSAAAGALRDIVTEKASTVSAFDGASIDGKSAADVDAIIAGSGSGGTADDTAPARVRALFPDLGDAEPGPASTEQAAQRCVQWLDEVFRPHFEAAIDTFDRVCHETDEAFDAIYRQLDDGLAEIDDAPYPAPLPPSMPSPTLGGSDHPVMPQQYAQPGTIGTPAPNPNLGAGQMPGGVAPELTALLNGLVPLAGAVTDIAGKVIDAVASVATDIAADLAEPADVEPDDHSIAPEKPSGAAEFDVPGGHVTIEPGDGEQLRVEVTGSDGRAREFTMSFDENGNPRIDDPAAADSDAADPAPRAPIEPPAPPPLAGANVDPMPATAPPEPEPAAPSPPEPEGGAADLAVSAGTQPRRGPSGEPTVDPPPPNEDSGSGDSGAELAEAGPL